MEGLAVAEVILEVTNDDLVVPHALLAELGYYPGQRLRVSRESDRLVLRPDELSSDEIEAVALSYLLEEVGDLAGLRSPESVEGEWRVEVVLLPAGQPVGVLWFDQQGQLVSSRSDSPAALIRAAEVVAQDRA